MRAPRPINTTVEAVGKVNLTQTSELKKNDLTECATINDLMVGKCQVTPENIILTDQKDFSYRLVGRITSLC
jgi:hypothetical protein